MKRILLISVATFVIAGWINSMVLFSTVRYSQEEISIPSIRQRYAAINKGVRKYKLVKKELSGFSLEGGELKAYFDGPRIVKMTAAYFGEIGRSTEEYYYWDEKLIFVLRRDYTYDEPLTGKVVRTGANRFYFANDRLIRWIDERGKARSLGGSEYHVKEKELLETSNQFLKAARSPKAVIEARTTSALTDLMRISYFAGSKLDDERNYRQAGCNRISALLWQVYFAGSGWGHTHCSG